MVEEFVKLKFFQTEIVPMKGGLDTLLIATNVATLLLKGELWQDNFL